VAGFRKFLLKEIITNKFQDMIHFIILFSFSVLIPTRQAIFHVVLRELFTTHKQLSLIADFKGG